MNLHSLLHRVRTLVREDVEGFENRFILAAGITGFIELCLALSPVGVWLGTHFDTYGYLGTGLIIMAVTHKLLLIHDKRLRS